MSQSSYPSLDGREMRFLDNGMAVLFDPMPHIRSVSMGAWIRTGSSCEPAPLSGISHFLEHLLFKGTSTRSARQLMEAVESRGGQINAFTGRDNTCLYVRMLDQHANAAVEILADVLRHSQFFDFEKERGVILEEIASAEDVPEDYVHDLLMLQFWPDHPLGRPVSGFEESVEAISIDDVRAYFQQWYRPDNMLLSVAGNFDPASLYGIIRDTFGDMTPGTASLPSIEPVFSSGYLHTERDITQSHLCLAFPAAPAGHPDHYAHELLASALGGGSTSRLFDRIREQTGLAYSVYAYHSHYRLAGMTGVYAAVAPENLEEAGRLCAEELDRIRQEPLPHDELAMNKEMYRSGYLMSLESTTSRMNQMARSAINYGRLLMPAEIEAGIDSVTSDDIQRLAQATLSVQQCAATVLGPEAPLERYAP